MRWAGSARAPRRSALPRPSVDKDARGTRLAQLAPLLTPRQVNAGPEQRGMTSGPPPAAPRPSRRWPHISRPRRCLIRPSASPGPSARSPRARADALRALAAPSPGTSLNRVLNEARRLKDVTLRAQVIAVLAPPVSPSSLDSAALRRAARSAGWRPGALFAAIAPYLSDRQHARAVTLAGPAMKRSQSRPFDRAEVAGDGSCLARLSRAVTPTAGVGDTDEIGRTLAYSLASFSYATSGSMTPSRPSQWISVLERPTALDALAPAPHRGRKRRRL